jgi:hypothetical protein
MKEEIVDESLKKIPKDVVKTLILSDIKLVNYGNETASNLKTNSTHALLFSMYEKPVIKYVPFELLIEQRFDQIFLDSILGLRINSTILIINQMKKKKD